MFFDELTMGQTFPIRPVRITEEAIHAFALAYDPLPVHLDAAYAEETPFKKIIAPGVMSFMAVWAEFLKTNGWGSNFIAGKNTKIEWLAPVYAGDVLHGEGRILERLPHKPGSGVVFLGIEIHNQHAVKVIYDTTELILKARPAAGA
ncbi:MAG: MaoC family dehydratase N-terminal domain-containing protein [Deltaproteobacteria bacterium]|nr:MaoC family dehydratase N-terminal domain-containing protein [Deltaproteobacteria bacterium]